MTTMTTMATSDIFINNLKHYTMKQFLLIARLLTGIAACTPKQAPKENKVPVLVELNLKVEGMTCDHCEASIATGVNLLAGIDSISANHEDSTAFVRFDTTQTDLAKITEAIEARGFHVAGELKSNNLK